MLGYFNPVHPIGRQTQTQQIAEILGSFFNSSLVQNYL